MKKFLPLMIALALSASTSQAQELLRNVPKTKRQSLNQQLDKIGQQKNLEIGIQAVGKPASRAVKRTAASGVYYSRPAGTMYLGWDAEGRGYGFTTLVSNPFIDTYFVDQSKKKGVSEWHLNMFDQTGEIAYCEDISQYASGDSLNFTSELGYYYPVPTITNLKDSFALSQIPYNSESYDGNYYWTNGRGTTAGGYFYTRMIADSIGAHTFIDDHAGGTYYWGVLDPKIAVSYNNNPRHYLFGTGTYTGKNEDGSTYVLVSEGVQQYFEKPQSPLYVEDIFINGYTFAEQPLAKDAKVVMIINDTYYDTEHGFYRRGEKEIARLECTANDITNMEPQAFGTGTMTQFTMNFSKKVVDAFGSESIEPVIIDEPFMVTVIGLSNDGVDIGLPGWENPAEDTLETGYVLYSIQGEEEGNLYTGPFYNGVISLNFVFNSCFDYAEVWSNAYTTDGTEITNFNVLKVSDDGQTVENMGEPQLDFVYTDTAFPWFNDQNEENYYLITANDDIIPEWISNVLVFEDEVEEGYPRNGRVYLSVQCEALPEGVSGRQADLYIFGRGYVSENPICVIQGNLSPDAINGTYKNYVEKNPAVYNMAGQKVSNNAKGMVVKNGRKFIVK